MCFLIDAHGRCKFQSDNATTFKMEHILWTYNTLNISPSLSARHCSSKIQIMESVTFVGSGVDRKFTVYDNTHNAEMKLGNIFVWIMMHCIFQEEGQFTRKQPLWTEDVFKHSASYRYRKQRRSICRNVLL